MSPSYIFKIGHKGRRSGKHHSLQVDFTVNRPVTRSQSWDHNSLVFPWNIGLWEIVMAAWLSTKIFVISFSTMCKSYRIFWSHNVWFIVVIAAINSAFAIDCATMSCFLDDHENIHDLRLKQNPKMIFMSSIYLPQSLSEKPYNFNFWLL